ncbi:MAG: lipoprotein-anchoring transpeptidase ErfK/SrfK [Lentimonas sp.]
MAKKRTIKHATQARRRPTKKKKNSRGILYSLTRLIVVLGIAAALYHYWPQLRTFAERAPRQPITTARAILDTTELQIALAREGFSPGSIDGSSGTQTKRALLAYQTAHDLPQTGTFDEATAQLLRIEDPVLIQRIIGQEDFANVAPKPQSWRARGQLDKMRFNSTLEMVAEQAQTDPDLITSLNPETNWSQLSAGDSIRIPHVPPFRIRQPAAYIQITLSTRTFRIFSAEHRLLFHCPVSIARRVDKRPSGELRVKVRVDQPNYTFNPAILSGTAQREGITQKFIIQPGPNNPVGTAWIGLNLPSYGMHGTPDPEKVGRTESSGCFRLANWNAQTILDAAHASMPIYVEP